MAFQFDGNPLDMATIIVAALSVFIRPIKRKIAKSQKCFSYRDVTIDFLSGTVIVPFSLLIGCTFSKTILEEALKSNKLFFTIGGAIGLFFVMCEYFNGD